ncbi:MAG TPA: Ig-like domain-containing protein [Gemmatimonadaceae bacterium]|nr:Ig-like domain-containing protein [Gemmatimonadaceae bacterium]
MRRSTTVRLCALVAATGAIGAIAAGCSADATLPGLRGGADTSVDCSLQSITVSPPSITLTVGDTAVFVAVVPVCGTTSASNAFTWRLSDSSIATIAVRGDSAVWLRARNPGTTTLIASPNATPAVQGAAAVNIVAAVH